MVGGGGIGVNSDKEALGVAFSQNRKITIFSIKEPVEIIYCDSKQKGCFIT